MADMGFGVCLACIVVSRRRCSLCEEKHSYLEDASLRRTSVLGDLHCAGMMKYVSMEYARFEVRKTVALDAYLP